MTALVSHEDNFETMTTSRKNQILEKLKEKNFLEYGSLISNKDIEFIMGEKEKMIDPDKWQFLKLELREVIKNSGFYVTERGREGFIYVLRAQEMAKFNEKRNRNMFKNLKQRQRALHMIDTSILTEEENKKLEFEILRNASFEIELASKLKERCRF